MPNILFTQSCVRSCPYCFAKKHMSESSPEDIISWEDLIYLADFLISAGERHFPILGGEPTLHPDFCSMVLYLLERGFSVNVFTSGIMADRKLDEAFDAFKSVPRDRLSFTCNLNDPSTPNTPVAETESVKRFLRAFGERVTPGFNIYRKDFDLDFLFRYINEFGLHRHIRMGVAHPIPGKKNRFIRPDEMDEIIQRLFSFKPMFERLRIKPGLDCGFPLCRFSEEQLGWLYRNAGGKYDFGCNPVIDIGPDLSVWACFPLSSYQKKSVYEFNSLRELHDFYSKLHNAVRTEVAGVYPECDGCNFREEYLCKGGCLAHNLSRFLEEKRVRLGEVYP
jgi:radical SAM protein with 4Fe4S-binding SPASM domain